MRFYLVYDVPGFPTIRADEQLFDRSRRGVVSNRVRANWDSSNELHDSSTMRKNGTARLAPWAHNLPVVGRG